TARRTRRAGPQHFDDDAALPDQGGDPGMSMPIGRAHALRQLAGDAAPSLRGIASVCSAHPLVIEQALRRAQAEGMPALIEATCNQVNQEGGYTGMTPADFRRFVEGIAEEIGFPRDRLLL